MKLCEDNNIFTDAQFGFRPILAIVSRHINTNKRLYCCFVDYTKAFDSIDHYHLWRRFLKIGIRGKLFEVITLMYDDIRCCIRLDGKYSDFYKCFKGLVQGDALSPLIVSLFVNDLESDLMSDNCPSLHLNEINVFLLMYADDIVLQGESPENLQTRLNSPQGCTQWCGLTVNTLKTKIVVFRSSLRMYDTENWTFDNDNIEVVDTFRHLGLVLNYNGKFYTTQKTLAAQTRKAMFGLMKTVKDNHFNVQTKLELLDTDVGSILNMAVRSGVIIKVQILNVLILLF